MYCEHVPVCVLAIEEGSCNESGRVNGIGKGRGIASDAADEVSFYTEMVNVQFVSPSKIRLFRKIIYHQH